LTDGIDGIVANAADPKDGIDAKIVFCLIRSQIRALEAGRRIEKDDDLAEVLLDMLDHLDFVVIQLQIMVIGILVADNGVGQKILVFGADSRNRDDSSVIIGKIGRFHGRGIGIHA
jgi:hypothetical protein